MFRIALALAVLLGLVVTPQASAASVVEVTNVGHNLMASGMTLRAVQFFGLDRGA